MIRGCRQQKVILLVPPYFFAHFHFYRRKLNALRANGMMAKMVAFVPHNTFLSEKERYNALDEDDVKIIIVNGKFSKYQKMIFYFRSILNVDDNVCFHVLRETSLPLILLKKLSRKGKNIKIIQEFEGDTRSEFVYAKEYSESPGPPEYPKNPINVLKYIVLTVLDNVKARFSDGLILMSDEHVAIWDKRIGVSKKKFVMSTLPLKKDVFFDAKSRVEKRKKLGLDNEVLFIYVGNVTCAWQRLSAMCNLFKEIVEIQPSAKFVMLIRVNDFNLVEKTIKECGIEKSTIFENVSHDDVYKFLSAADVGFFLRHDHIMNRVVTSGKLGEYLASGMRVLTTGANAKSLNRFIANNDRALFLDDDLRLTQEVKKRISAFLSDCTSDIDREKASEVFFKEYNLESIIMDHYPKFISEL
jgi:hypothetical protein